jgi:hypothetical protein
MWKGGLPNCKECNKSLGDSRAEYCTSCWQKGERNPAWNPSYNREDRENLRINSEHIEWAKAVKKRDDYTCQKCKDRGVVLNSHHIESFSKNKELRYALDNGITLCKTCHKGFHEIFGLFTNRQHLEIFLKD